MVNSVGNSRLVGNRMMLSGALLYLLELVGGFWIDSRGVHTSVSIGTSTGDLLASFQGNETALFVGAGWISLVAIGRILIIIGLKNSLAASGRTHPIMEFAVVMMAMSVAFEILTYTLFASAAQLGAAHPEAMVAMSWTSGALNGLYLGSLGLSVLCASWAMLRSELFPKVLSIIGMIAGIPLALIVLFISPSLSKISDGLAAGIALYFIWMLWAGILLWKKAPKMVPAQV